MQYWHNSAVYLPRETRMPGIGPPLSAWFRLWLRQPHLRWANATSDLVLKRSLKLQIWLSTMVGTCYMHASCMMQHYAGLLWSWLIWKSIALYYDTSVYLHQSCMQCLAIQHQSLDQDLPPSAAAAKWQERSIEKASKPSQFGHFWALTQSSLIERVVSAGLTWATKWRVCAGC